MILKKIVIKPFIHKVRWITSFTFNYERYEKNAETKQKLNFILDESDIFWRGSCSNATEMILKAEELGKVKQIFFIS